MTDTEFAVRIGRVTEVQPHSTSENLDVVTIAGKVNVANRPAHGRPRYRVGDYAVVLQEGLILPDALIKHLDMWDDVKNKGCLAGGKGNRTKGRRVGGVLSEVALCAVEWEITERQMLDVCPSYLVEYGALTIPGEGGGAMLMQVFLNATNPEKSTSRLTPEGYDVAALLGITPYIPPA